MCLEDAAFFAPKKDCAKVGCCFLASECCFFESLVLVKKVFKLDAFLVAFDAFDVVDEVEEFLDDRADVVEALRSTPTTRCSGFT